jgi:hypothetical protein
MSEHGKDGALSCLFEQEDKRLVNIKFFRGDKKVITEDEFCAQINSVAKQKGVGGGTHSPVRSTRPPVDVKKLVDAL